MNDRPEAEPTLRASAAMSSFLLYRSMDSGPAGLTEAEAARRVTHTMPEYRHRTAAVRSLRRVGLALGSPFVALLAGLDIVFAVLGDAGAAITVAAMILLAVALRLWQQGRSSRAVAALRRSIPSTMTVRRRASDGDPAVEREVPVDDVVAGDIVVLRPGDALPVDVRIVTSLDLLVDQSTLSGESLPVGKSGEEEPSFSTRPVPASSRLCLAGTTVLAGSATAVVLATGAATYARSLVATARRLPRRSSFDRGVQSVGWTLIRFMLVMIPSVMVIRGLVDGSWAQAAVLAVAVAVGLTPEMLPVVVTSNLARGAMRMAGQKVIVNRLNAIADLGAMDVLCVDKTGTLTEDRIVYAHSLNTAGRLDGAPAWYAAIAERHRCDVDIRYGEAITALVTEAPPDQAGAGEHTKIAEIGFDYTRRRSTMVVADGAAHILICRGDPDRVLECCSRIRTDHGDIEMCHQDESWRLVLGDCHARGFQVQAIAIRRGPARFEKYGARDERDLVLLGFLCFLDPLRANVSDTIATLETHGVGVRILTGDAQAVAVDAAVRAGLDVASAVVGDDLEDLDEDQLLRRTNDTTVFAELTPDQKARVVTAFQRAGAVVGFVGDGLNDIAALRAADAGIAADTSTPAAKSAADFILLDRDLGVIADGVLEGRRTVANTLKYVRVTASSNFGNALSLVAASALVPIVPILPVQLLVQNLLYDLAQLALPWDHVDPDYLSRPRTWRSDGLVGFIVIFGLLSSVFDVFTFGALWFAFGGDRDHAVFQSGWFLEGLLSQLLVVLVLRTGGAPWGRRRPSLAVISATVAAAAAGCWLPFSPLAAELHMSPLSPACCSFIGATVLVYAAAAHVVKRVLARRQPRARAARSASPAHLPE
ncbi:magnesium-translocating P-type ATPase [Mycolicibacterium fluoranthenivorans]|uniref:Mg2+-importing ATPase n=1 Tax=Mycolicibacterium fluoranthenivorans TaxID=258505 RepID=A0A1G4WQV0_9MYCO|nr:magnesium-translocating P-type ATPase [Mycolicibacterium fluoranthenivorans]SCX27664.1 Mg2+-importing ATPase [Mycolicibacterium fluoranthenivorans]